MRYWIISHDRIIHEAKLGCEHDLLPSGYDVMEHLMMYELINSHPTVRFMIYSTHTAQVMIKTHSICCHV